MKDKTVISTIIWPSKNHQNKLVLAECLLFRQITPRNNKIAFDRKKSFQNFHCIFLYKADKTVGVGSNDLK